MGGKTVIAVSAAIASVALMLASPARAAPYKFCTPNQDPDCYFIYVVNEQVFRVAPAEIGTVIAKGQQACSEMSADTGANPIINWARRFSAKNGLSGDNAGAGIDRKALQFADVASVAYCPWVRG